MNTPQRASIIVVAVFAVVLATVIAVFYHELQPVAPGSSKTVVFEVKQGDGFRSIADNLSRAGLVRSAFAFELYSLAGGKALTLKAGLYRLSPGMGASEILGELAGKKAGEVTVTVPEGSNIYEIDKILSDALVTKPGALVHREGASGIEGTLFPDTYEFFTGADVNDVIKEFTDNFKAKAGPVLAKDAANEKQNLIIASILEREVPDNADREVIAGILEKRLTLGMPLGLDTTVCYAKQLRSPDTLIDCTKLTGLDFKLDSPYNTYLYKGLPPGPIGNPGVSAIEAAEHPKSSPYLYYLSDPATGKTIFAKTLDEQNQNRVKYLVR